MAWGVTAVVGASVVTGIMGANAASDAADTQARAANRATAAQLQMYQQQRADQAPWRDAGARALTQMENPEHQREFTMADFQADPGYEFRMAEGQKAIERSAAARGGLNSGDTLKALSRYGQNVASNEYGKAVDRFNNNRTLRFNQLASLAGNGQVATNNIGAAGQNYANQAGQNMMGAANAQAAGQIGQANAFTNMAGQGANTWMQYQTMNRLLPQQVPTPTSTPSFGNSGGQLNSGGGYSIAGNRNF